MLSDAGGQENWRLETGQNRAEGISQLKLENDYMQRSIKDFCIHFNDQKFTHALHMPCLELLFLFGKLE